MAWTPLTNLSSSQLWTHINTLAAYVDSEIVAAKAVAASALSAFTTALGITSVQRGTVAVTFAAQTAVGVTISFPVGKFTAPPTVTASLATDGLYTINNLIVHTVTATGASVRVQSSTAITGTMNVQWVAVQ